MHLDADAGQSEVIAFLSDPASHGIAGPVRRIDTHGAMVFLAGDDVWKIKRAVRFPFMDFSTLEKRRAVCEREIAVNRPHAPALYLGAVPIVRHAGRLRFGGEGEILEWAVHLRRFDETRTLDRLVENGPLPARLVDALPGAVLAFHREAARHEAGPWLEALARWIDQAEAALRGAGPLFDEGCAADVVARLREALRLQTPLLRRRAGEGQVRRGHGDLHLANIVCIADAPVLFDAIEFDETIAIGDVLYDLAFLLMDLCERGQRSEACAILNRYLWQAGTATQIDGLAALPLFLALRAVIRSHVGAARARLAAGGQRARAEAEARAYLAFAQAALRPVPPALIAIGGLSGTGKTTVASLVAPLSGAAPGAVHLRSDVERKAMEGVAEFERLPAERYTRESTAAVYAQLRALSARALAAGRSVIVDAVHLAPEERAGIAAVAAAAGVPFRGFWLDLPLEARIARIEGRGRDASDADAQVARLQDSLPAEAIGWVRLAANGAPAALARTIGDELTGG